MTKTIVDREALPFWGVPHPTTGKPIQALGWRHDGSPLWPIFGADEGDGTGSEGGEGAEDESEDDEGDEGSGEGSDSAKVSKEEYDKLQARIEAMKRQLSAADKNKSAAEKKLEELARKEKSDLENASTDLKKATEENASLRETVKKMALKQAFLDASMASKVSWHDSKIAMAAADLQGVEVNDEGEVTGDLRKIVKELAKSRAYLVNSSTEGDGEEEEDEKRGPSGSRVGTGARKNAKSDKGKPSEDALRKMFPALNK